MYARGGNSFGRRALGVRRLAEAALIVAALVIVALGTEGMAQSVLMALLAALLAFVVIGERERDSRPQGLPRTMTNDQSAVDALDEERATRPRGESAGTGTAASHDLGNESLATRAPQTAEVSHGAVEQAETAARSLHGSGDDNGDIDLSELNSLPSHQLQDAGSSLSVDAPNAAQGARQRASAGNGLTVASVSKARGSSSSQDATPRASFAYEDFALTLLKSADPLDELRLFVRDVRKRRQRRDDSFPTAYERFCARMLTEAGIFTQEEDEEQPKVIVVRPQASQMLYLRMHGSKLGYRTKARLLAIEAALNAVRFSASYFDEPNERTLVEHYQLAQRLACSICAQSPNLSEHVPVIEDEDPDSEWAVRLGISTAIESLQLPHRLEAKFRTNVADGNVAISIALPPEEAFPGSSYVEGIGLVPTSRDMRRRASADYGLRLALLVAACAFRCSERVFHVWVSAYQETPVRRACLLAVDFDRWRFERLDLSDLGDLAEVYRRFAATMRLEEGVLRPVADTFSLDEPRFCPPERYAPVSLSPRQLSASHAVALGTSHVSGLAIDEATKRAYVAGKLMSKVGSSTEESVHAILAEAGDDPDPSVRSAAERCVAKLIDGSIEGDAASIMSEFVTGDSLSEAVRQAHSAIGSRDLSGARRILSEALSPIDRAGLFADSATVEYRYFGSYVDRTLYNRLFALEGHTSLLVPEPYYEAHLLLSAACLMEGDVERALTHARRLVEFAPLDARARLHLSHCLEVAGDSERAVESISELLLIAHDAEGLGLGYYRMAFFQWQKGNVLAAQACYLRAMRYFPAIIPVIAMELATLSFQSQGQLREEMDDEEIDELLASHGIPQAPTERMSATFTECARAALDAEVFPVARSFVEVLSTLSHDDILMGLIRSIESEPEA